MLMRHAVAALLLIAGLPVAAAGDAADDAQLRQFVDSLHFSAGTVAIGAAHATLKLAPDFRFLDAHDAQRVLSDLWGNPPDDEVLGMILPSASALTDETNGWAVVVTYSSDGHIADGDASTIDYDKLLAQMQQETRAANSEREKQGYPAVQLVGWATPPHYDASTSKLYWAKELDFAGAREHMLNYDIRVLGRGGYLSLNAIAAMSQLDLIQRQMPEVLAMTEFDPGQRYADFDATTDKVAAYGISALVAGAIAAKAGLFAKLFALLLAFKKVAIAACIAFAALVRKLFARRA